MAKKQTRGFNAKDHKPACEVCGEVIHVDEGRMAHHKKMYYRKGKTVCFTCKEQLDGPHKYPEDEQYTKALRAHRGLV